MSPQRSRGSAAALAIFAALGAVYLWVNMLVGPLRLATGLIDAQRHLKRAEKALSRTAMKQARYETLAAGASARRARDGLASGSPLFALARAVGPVADVLGEAPHFVAAAEHSGRAAAGTLDIAQNALRGPDKVIAKDPDDPDGGSIVHLDRVRAIGQTISVVRDEIRAARRELEAIDPGRVPRRLRNRIAAALDKARETQEVLADAAAGFAILPAVLGEREPRTYLIGMQNSAELRGTGGAMLQFALLTIARGKPSFAEEASTVYDVDRNRDPVSIPLPEDAWLNRGIADAQRFGNANWSPDWPLSARLTLAYANATPEIDFPVVDGVIGVDPVFVQELMPGVGPYHTARSGNYITANRVVHFVLYKAYASFPIPSYRRAVLRQVVDGFYKGLLKPQHPTALLQGMGDALAGKHMQVWLTRPEEQAFIERMEWDGGIEEAAGSDYAYVVEQNVGGNKLDNFATQETSIEIRIEGDDARHRTRVAIANRIFLPQPRWPMGDSGPNHRPYISLYVPGDAELAGASVEGSRLDQPPALPLAAWPAPRVPAEHHEHGRKVWSATLLIPPGDEGLVLYDYRSPGVVRTEEGRRVYRLVIQHQPKVRPEDLLVRLEVPEGATDVRAPGWSREGDLLMFETTLDHDLVLEVSWRA